MKIDPMQKHPAAPMPAKALFWILAGLVAVGYVGYKRFLSPDAATEKPAGGAEILQTSNPAFYGTKEAGGPVLRMTSETAAGLTTITPSRLVMFATSWCPYCAQARKLFNEQGVRYSELDIEIDKAAASFQTDVMGLQGVPTIVIGNRVMQGFDRGAILTALKEP